MKSQWYFLLQTAQHHFSARCANDSSSRCERRATCCPQKVPGRPDVLWTPHNPVMYVTASPVYSGEIEAQRACVTHPRSHSWHVADLVVESMMSTLRGDTIYILLSVSREGHLSLPGTSLGPHCLPLPTHLALME